MYNDKDLILSALEELKRQNGPDFKLENGDAIAAQFDNCALIMTMEDDEVSIHFIPGVIHHFCLPGKSDWYEGE